jgi:predicted O-methyltransferase YrrM
MWPTIYQKYNTATLHIYSDIDHKWSNDVEPEKMLLIKNLLSEYNYKENGFGIHYHGWVDKTTLADAWTTADIWFYPCTFMETFCLTALEAASSKTLCVTNDLAALQNTVGNRGVIIKGDPTTEEWTQQALELLFYIMDDTNCEEKNNFINNNYNWSKTLSWENQAIKLLKEYIYPNNIFEYKGMYNWTHDIPAGSKDVFLKVISYFNNNYHKIKFGKQVSILEIGTYTGTSLIELIKLIPNSTGIAIDMWANYNETDLLNVIDNYNVKQSFYKNIKNAGLQDKIQPIQLDSTTALIQFIKDNKTTDFIYVDASHLLLDCYTDLALSWQILEKGGILAIDDYLYDKNNILNSPHEAINHFLKIFKGKYKILDIGYRVFLEKI